MSIALAQAAGGAIVSSSLSLTLGSNPTAGNLLTFGLATYGSLASPPSSTGDTWAKAVAHSASNEEADIWYAADCAGGSGDKTVSATASTGRSVCWYDEWSGVKTSSPLDGTSSSGTFTPGSISPTGNDLVLAVAYDLGSGAGGSGGAISAPSGFTDLGAYHDSANVVFGDSAYVVSSSTQNPTFGGSGGTYQASAMAAFKAGVSAYTASATDSLVITDHARGPGPGRSTDSLVISDAARTKATLGRVHDSLFITDSARTTATRGRSSDALVISSSASGRRSTFGNTSDSLVIADHATGRQPQVRATDALSIVDASRVSVSLHIHDALVITDAATAAFHARATATDALSIVDAVTIYVHYQPFPGSVGIVFSSATVEIAASSPSADLAISSPVALLKQYGAL